MPPEREIEAQQPHRTHFTLAALMELTAACAVSASVGWLVGLAASFALMLAALGLVLRQGWLTVLALGALVIASSAGPRRFEEAFVSVGVSLLLLGVFALVRVGLRRVSAG